MRVLRIYARIKDERAFIQSRLTVLTKSNADVMLLTEPGQLGLVSQYRNSCIN
ncbi:hypothetical protein BN135_520 [Cronobacter muytjensii 530]